MSATDPALITTRFSRRRRTLAGAFVILAAFSGVACGDDEDDDEAATATTAAPTTAVAVKPELVGYCDATFKIESYFAEDPDVDFETASPEQIAAALKTYLEGAKPLVDAVVPIAPADIKEPLNVLVAAFNQALAGADPETVFDTPETMAAEDKTHAFDLKNCGWGKVDVSGSEYSFTGLPATVKPGRTSIDFSNKGKELHEIGVLTKNPGVTETFDQILALPEEEAMTKVRPVVFAFAAPGEDDYVVADLEPGNYLAVCFIPQGLVSEEGPPPAEDAKPHFVLGMKQEFKVA